MSEVSSLTNSAITAKSLGNLVLVTPQSKQPRGYIPKTPGGASGTARSGFSNQNPSSLIFHYEAENSIDLVSDITDHYIEDNTAIQDQIALKPEEITVSGFVGELNNVVPESLLPLKLIADKLLPLSVYAPEQSISAITAYNQAKFLYDTAATTARNSVQSFNTVFGDNDIATIGGEVPEAFSEVPFSRNNKSLQQVMFNQFYGYWFNRYLFDVQTPWGMMENMAIKTLKATQDETTNMITDFRITFKKLRFAQTSVASGVNLKYDASNFQGRLNQQGSVPVNFGSQVGQDATVGVSSLWGSVA